MKKQMLFKLSPLYWFCVDVGAKSLLIYAAVAAWVS